MTRPRLLDLFCGGGGAGVGYHRAGFEVVGVDLVRQPEYPYEFHQADALTFPVDGFYAVHASPPCKPFTPAGNRDHGAERLFDPHPDCLTPTLARFATLTIPWVVENVVGAPMPAGSVTYCGSSFGLAVRRHRLFASNVALTAPPCAHDDTPRYQSLEWAARKVGRLAACVGVQGNLQGGTDTLELRQWAMGIDWLPNDRLTQAIPPAYTEHIGRQLIGAIMPFLPDVPDDEIGNSEWTADGNEAAYEAGFHDGCDYGYRLAERELVCPGCGRSVSANDGRGTP